MKTLTLIRGLPGSGKSTLAKKLAGDTGEVIPLIDHFEADMFFIGFDGSYNFIPERIGEAHAWCQAQAERVLTSGHDVIVSNTFTTERELRPYFEIAKNAKAQVVVYLAQNSFQNVHGVPPEVLVKMRKRFDYQAVDRLMWEFGYVSA